MQTPTFRRRFCGAAGLLAVAALVLGLVGVYQHAFTPHLNVVVMSDRSGLLLDPGADVRAYGVPIGEVRGTRLVSQDRVAIDVALDPHQAKKVPSAVAAEVSASTLFGAKYIELLPPARHSAVSIHAGDVIEARSVTPEANDTFHHAMGVLEAIDVENVNTVLNQSAAALRGRGPELGEYISTLNAYLDAFNPHLPALSDDLERAPHVLSTYADSAPDLVATASHLATTSATLDENADTLDAFLTDTTAAAESVDSLLGELENPLVSTIREITPVTDLLRVYAPEVGCLIENLDTNIRTVSTALGNVDAGMQGKTGFLPGQAPYRFDRNLPKLVTGVGPICYPSPTRARPVLPHVRFDDGTKTIYDGVGPVVDPGTLHDSFGHRYQAAGSTRPTLEPIVDYLALVQALFGLDGLDRVLAALEGTRR